MDPYEQSKQLVCPKVSFCLWHLKVGTTSAFSDFCREVEHVLPANLDDASAAVVGKLFGRAWTALEYDARDFRRRAFAKCIGDLAARPLEWKVMDLAFQALAALDPFHVDVLQEIRSLPPADKGREGEDARVTFPQIEESLRAREAVSPNFLRPMLASSTSALVQYGVLSTRMMETERGRMMYGINPTGLVTRMAFALTSLGERVFTYLQ